MTRSSLPTAAHFVSQDILLDISGGLLVKLKINKMAKILNTKEDRKKQNELYQLKQFNEYNDALQYLFECQKGVRKATIWRYFDKWSVAINWETPNNEKKFYK